MSLDTFRWMKLWDKAMSDVNSAEASIFRGMPHKSLFIVESSECNQAKLVLRRRLRREPIAKETLKETKATTPESETLLRWIDAVAPCACFSDLTNRMPIPANAATVATGNSAVNCQRTDRSGRHFKPMNRELRELIDNQMQHVRKGCLSDPHKSVVRIHQVNPLTYKAHTAQSTGSTEDDNVWLNRPLNTPTVVIARAERAMSDHHEESNGRKEVTCLGGEEQITPRTKNFIPLTVLPHQLDSQDLNCR